MLTSNLRSLISTHDSCQYQHQPKNPSCTPPRAIPVLLLLLLFSIHLRTRFCSLAAMAETAPDPKRQRLDDDEVDQPEADVEAGASGQEEIDEADDGVEEGPSGEVDICGFLGVDPELLQTYDQQQAVLEQVRWWCLNFLIWATAVARGTRREKGGSSRL